MARPRTNTVAIMVRVNGDLKKQAEAIYEEMGITLYRPLTRLTLKRSRIIIVSTPIIQGQQAVKIYHEANQKPKVASRIGAEILNDTLKMLSITT